MKRLYKIFLLVFSALLLTLPLTSCSDRSQQVVGTCGGHEILYEEVRFHVLSYLKNHPDATNDEVKSELEQELFKTYTVFTIAADRGCNTGDALNAAVDAAVETAISDLGGKSAYKNYLKENNLTNHLFRHLMTQTQLEIELGSKLSEHLANRDTLLNWLENGNYARVRRILIPATEENRADMERKAEEVRRALLNGASPDTLFTAEERKAGMTCNSAEYLYRGLSDTDSTEQENAALALSNTGDISQTFSTPHGFLIFLRVENDRQTLIEYQLNALLERYRNQELNTLIETYVGQLPVEWNEYGSGLDLRNLQ